MTVITTAATTATATIEPAAISRSGALGLLRAALQLPFEFALGVGTSLFIGRHGR